MWPRGRFPGGPGRAPAGRLWMLVAGISVLLGGSRFSSRGLRRVVPQRFRWALVVSGLLLLMLTGVSCEQYGYNVIGSPNITGTLSGNYTVTLLGTLAGNSSVVRSTTVNLTVGPG
jgi:peptidoglycan/LPS O-acetylase OafA/YrhL